MLVNDTYVGHVQFNHVSSTCICSGVPMTQCTQIYSQPNGTVTLEL